MTLLSILYLCPWSDISGLDYEDYLVRSSQVNPLLTKDQSLSFFNKFHLKGMPGLAQRKFYFRILRHFRTHFVDAATPGFDQFLILENGGEDAVADFAAAVAQFFDWHGIGQGAGAGDLQQVVIDGYLDLAAEQGIVPVDHRVGQGFADGVPRIQLLAHQHLFTCPSETLAILSGG